MKKKYAILFILFLSVKTFAQNIQVGAANFEEERLRNEQLMGLVNQKTSFMIRPLSNYLVDSVETKMVFKILPFLSVQQFNLKSPVGWNDGAMIPAKGYQTLLSGGVYFKYGPLSVQLKPEYVYAANPYFESETENTTDVIKLHQIQMLNHAQIIERFGDKSYSKLGWGQSSVRLNYRKLSFGLSTENLWWGPGKRNSLVMSNNAPGFLHFTLNTIKPIESFIGSFEAQIIAGKLENSNVVPPMENFTIGSTNYYMKKQNDWRYVTGFSATYQPKWVPGLFFGVNRIFQIYNNELGNGFSDYFPWVTSIKKNNLPNEDEIPRDQLASFSVRYVLKEAKAEIYMEQGWNDAKANFQDFFESPEHSKAYTIGFSKLFSITGRNENYVKFAFEHTQLQQSQDMRVRNAGSWYEHGKVFHGYTHNGKVLGAGIGPGGNSQTIDISIWKNKECIGLQVERYAHNMDMFYNFNSPPNSFPFHYTGKWIDLNSNLYAYKAYGNLGIQAMLNTVWSHNYQWKNVLYTFNPQFKFSLTYRFKNN
ncbi:MAG: capsule assembly Wzi family protein [Sphingobacteriaceae bacterium]|nr:capsule assembly Wzi family protein [Sphingobacteriaceae bacterium]